MAQTYPVDWDVDKYYDETEPDHHWELRKKFILKHKGQFAEDYLIALATCFTNVEFMGCLYPSKVMRLIAELSKDVAKEYREERKSKLQRTFVKASEAAENKAKRKRTTL